MKQHRTSGAPPPRLSRADRVWVLAATCLILAHAAWQVWQVAAAPIPVRYDYDEGVYAETAAAAARGQRLYSDLFLSQPPVFILALRAIYSVAGASLVSARCAGVLFSTTWPFALIALLRYAGRPRAGAIAAVLLLGTPAFVKMGHTVELEIPGEALACIALALAARAARGPGLLGWAAGGAVAVLAGMTKLTAATCAVPFVLAVASGGRAGAGRRLLAAAAGGAVTGAFLIPYIGAPGFREQVLGFHFALAHLPEVVALDKGAVAGGFLLAQWPLAAAATLGLAFAAIRGGWLEWAAVAWLAADAIGFRLLAPLWEHHLVAALSPMALLAGTGLDRVLEMAALLRRPARWGMAAVGLCALAVYLRYGASGAEPASTSPALQAAVAQIAAAVPPDGHVLTDDPMLPFLARRAVVDQLIDTSLTRIWSGQIGEAGLGAALAADRTDAAVFWRGTFHHYFPRLEAAAASRFRDRIESRPGHVLFLNRERGSVRSTVSFFLR
jgi:4-amino-4-deoxy-L-arabinose transferase-like glycosyltransferase